MATPLPPAVVLASVLGLLGVGLYGLLVSRNLIKLLLVLQILAKAAIVALVLAGRIGGQPNLGQSLSITVIAADTVVAIIGLALVIQVHRRMGTLDVHALSRLRG